MYHKRELNKDRVGVKENDLILVVAFRSDQFILVQLV